MPQKPERKPGATSVIPREEWSSFFEGFGHSHQGWLTSLETIDHVTQETVSSHRMPLQSIELDLEDEKNPRINVTVRSDNKVFKHILFMPSHLILHSSHDGQESLEIETINTTTRVHLEPHGKSLPVI